MQGITEVCLISSTGNSVSKGAGNGSLLPLGGVSRPWGSLPRDSLSLRVGSERDLRNLKFNPFTLLTGTSREGDKVTLSHAAIGVRQ